MKKFILGLFFAVGLALNAQAVSYQAGGGTAPTATDSQTVNNLVVNGNSTLGSGTEDAVTLNADAVSIPNDTVITLGGGASGLRITGDVILSSNSLVDAYTASFGAVTAGSTSTVTWTEVTDRLGEFVTSSFTVTLAGYYEVIVHSGVSQTAGSGCLLVKLNGALVTGGEACNQGVTGLASVLDVSVTRILSLAAADIVRVDASATTANATFQKATFTIKRLP